MVEEYLNRCYLPSHGGTRRLSAERAEGGRSELAVVAAEGRAGVGAGAGRGRASPGRRRLLRVGGEFPTSKRRCGSAASSPDEVEVQLCHGLLDPYGEVIADPQAASPAA